MNDAPGSPKRRSRPTRWAGVALFWVGLFVVSAVTAALVLGFELFLRISFHDQRTRTLLLILAGASLVLIMVRADWMLYRETRRIKREQERGER